MHKIADYRTVGGNAALGPRIYEGAVTAVGGDWGSPNILPPASFHSATPLASAGGKGCGAHFKQSDKLKFETYTFSFLTGGQRPRRVNTLLLISR
jgi:hypothetical protein